VIEPFSVHLVGIENPSDQVMAPYWREYLFNYRRAMAALRQAKNPMNAKRNYIIAMNCLTILRVFCNFMVPSIMTRVEAEKDEDDQDGYEYYYEHPMAKEEMLGFYDTSPKIRSVYENIISWLPRSPHSKILIFSSFVTTLDVLETILNEKNKEIKTLKYTGKMNKDQREESITRFCDVSSERPSVMLASIGAGNCGINLVPCSTVFIVDIPLNPFEILQAVNRVHRLTQTNHVNVVKFYMKGMIEKDILMSHNRKIKEASGAGLKVDLIDIGKD
jgi:SNF2 family DNA or RNA helicase